MSQSAHTKQAEVAKRPQWLVPLILIGMLAVAAVAVILGNRSEPFEPLVTGAPSAEVDQASVDHGNVRFNQPVESTFRIRNVGDQILRILGEPQVELLEGC